MAKGMKKDISYLPKKKQEELKLITGRIRDICRIEFIILYGSYARGDYVEHDVTYAKGLGYPEEFRSDFDILIILESRSFVNQISKKINGLEEYLNRSFFKQEITSPVSLLFYGIDEINDLLEKEANPFFKDVTEQGICLYNSTRFQLSKAHKIDAKQKKELAQKYYDYWFKKAQGAFNLFISALKGKENNWAAFLLHQATEACFNAILLIHSFYSPKAHDIKKFLDLTKRYDKSLMEVFPTKDEEDKRLFELLRASYVDARYSPAFKITTSELEQISVWVKNLLEITETLCSKKISEYG